MFSEVNAQMVTSISWAAAEAVLQDLLPGCKSFAPDTIADAAREQGYEVEFVPMADWESRTDRDILDVIIKIPVETTENMIVITEASYFRDAGPFSMSGSDFCTFPEQHFVDYGECAVGGDFVVLRPQQHFVILFHHEGYFASIDTSSGLGKAEKPIRAE